MNTGLTFNNDPALKEALLAEGRHHREADMLIKGAYGDGEGDDFKGCSIGCYFKGDHQKILSDFQISPRVSYFADTMFEKLPDPANKNWHVEWVSAIPVGASKSQINLVMDKLQLMMLRQKAEWFGAKYIHHILVMAKLFERATNGDEPHLDEWNVAARDAWDAWAAWAARAARDARAARAARDARDARDAWDAWDARDARESDFTKFYLRVREAYLSLMADLHLEVQRVLA